MLNPGYILSNRYKIIRALGRGGQSDVYLIEDTRLKGKSWVAKEMTVQYDDPRNQSLARRHFEQEANLLATLEHPNLPRVVDYFNFKGQYYLIMEFVEGEDLGVMLSRATGPFPEEQVARWAIQITTVLYYLHRQPRPVIFRDIKPSNIMLHNGHVKIIDFGIARHFNPAKKGDTLRIGSPGYSPPEQYSSQTDQRSDIYSLGVTMHHLLTLQDPANMSTPFQLPPIKVFNSDVSSRMIYIVEKATQIDPDRRYQNALEMKNDLKDLLGLPETIPVASQPIPETSISRTVPSLPAFLTKTDKEEPAPPTNFMPGEKLTKKHDQKDEIPERTADEDTKQKNIPDKQEEPSEKPPSLKKSTPFIAFAIFLMAMALTAYIASSLITRPDLMKKFSFMAQNLRPSPTPSKVALPEKPLEKGIYMLEQGNYRQAVENFLTARKESADNPLILFALNRALALASKSRNYHIGIIYDENGSESEKAIRKQILQGIALAQRNANFEGGIAGAGIIADLIPIKPGKKSAEEILNILARKPACLICIGNTNSIADLKSLNQARIPVIIIDNGNKTENDDNFFILRNSLECRMRALARGIAFYTPRRPLIIYRTGFEDSARKYLEKQFTELKLENFVFMEYSGDGMKTDSEMKRIRQLNPDITVIIAEPETAVITADTLRRAGLKGRIFLPSETELPETAEALGDVSMISPYYRGPENLSAYYFNALFRETYSAEPGYYSAMGYDSLNLFIRSARRACPETDRIKEYLNETEKSLTLESNNPKDREHWWGISESASGGWKETGGIVCR